MSKMMIVIFNNISNRLSTFIALAVAFFVPLLVFSATPTANGKRVLIASGGQTALKVVVSPTASDAVKRNAADLSDMLGKITGAKFAVDVGDGQNGLAVGTAADFPQAPVNGRFASLDPMRGDEYFIKTHAKGAWLVGATDTAAGHAVWDFLYRLGYRQYFPGHNWEIIPVCRELEVAMDVYSAPDYITRQIWYQWGTFNNKLYNDWCKRNRINSHFNLRNSHMYSDIVSQNKQEFEKHPEYYALVNGVRNGSKLCISNPELRKLTSDYVVRWFEKNPKADSSSIEPTDGAGYCECAECAKLGSISDRTVLLANEVAAAVQAKYGTTKYLGMLAYYQHFLPPSIMVHPQVIVTVCTRFGPEDVSVHEAMDGWKKQGAKLGYYDYYSVHTWHRDLPGYPGGSRIDYISGSIPGYHRDGARFFSAESGDNWGPCGLGYFLASRILWDINESSHSKELRSEFLKLCFKKAEKPMDEFYDLIDGTNRDIQLEDILGQMYRRLAEGRELETDPAVLARIDDLVMYTRYVELYRGYEVLKKAKSPRQKEFEDLIKYSFRICASGMVHTVALVQDLPPYDKEVTLPPEAKISGSKEPSLWQNSAIPPSPEEIAQTLANGIRNNPLLPFKAVRYSSDLVPAAKALGLSAVTQGKYANETGRQIWYTWLEAGQKLSLAVAGPNVQLRLYSVGSQGNPDSFVTKVMVNLPRPRNDLAHGKEIVMESPCSGLHRIELTGPGCGGTQITANGVPWTIASNVSFWSADSLYFYVPMGTKTVVGTELGYKYGRGQMKDSSGTVVWSPGNKEEREAFLKNTAPSQVNNRPKIFQVPVPPGQDGKLWKMESFVGTITFYNIPPYYARSAEELLLPREVVERDAKK